MTRVHIRWDRRPAQPAAKELRKVISGCLKRLRIENAEVHLVLTGDQTIRELNSQFRDIDEATDVLSFPDGEVLPSGRRFLGEIVISLDSAQIQAKSFGHDEVRELSELSLHGTLHLLGYDHSRDQGEMNEIELQLRQDLLP